MVALRLLQRRRQRAHPPAHVRRQRQVLHLHHVAASTAAGGDSASQRAGLKYQTMLAQQSSHK